jgi:hypothetical protein
MPNTPKPPEDFAIDPAGNIFVGGMAEESPSDRLERKKRSARCGHIKRRLVRNKPLTGDLLEFALSIVAENNDADTDEVNGIARKLNAGQQLSDYELHIMVDVLLLHKRLSHL